MTVTFFVCFTTQYSIFQRAHIVLFYISWLQGCSPLAFHKSLTWASSEHWLQLIDLWENWKFVSHAALHPPFDKKSCSACSSTRTSPAGPFKAPRAFDGVDRDQWNREGHFSWLCYRQGGEQLETGRNRVQWLLGVITALKNPFTTRGRNIICCTLSVIKNNQLWLIYYTIIIQ